MSISILVQEHAQFEFLSFVEYVFLSVPVGGDVWGSVSLCVYNKGLFPALTCQMNFVY